MILWHGDGYSQELIAIGGLKVWSSWMRLHLGGLELWEIIKSKNLIEKKDRHMMSILFSTISREISASKKRTSSHQFMIFLVAY